MEDSPLVSICIPAYNAVKYILETINCLTAQTYQHIEIIVVDDNSADDTFLQVSKVGDNRLKILKNPKKGAAAARNFAYQNSSGSYIVFFDSDDIVMSGFIESQL